MIDNPYATLLGIRAAPDVGANVLVMPPAPRVEGRPGFLHGGAIAGLLELAAYVALEQAFVAAAEEAPSIKPVNVSVDFMRNGRLVDCFAVGRVVRLGRRIANVTAEAWQTERDRPIAAARITMLLDR